MGKPKVRFKGYTDDWEQRKFADFTWDAGKRNREDLDLEPYAITNEHGFIRQCDAHDDFGYMKDTDRKAYNIVQPNSFAYNPARINVGSIGYYKGVENVIVSSLYEVFQTDNYVNDRFLWHWFKSDEFPRWIERLQEGSVRLYFYYDKLCECRLYMPSLEEQEKIASFLDALDHLITLHQCKYNTDKNRESFAWEQRKVSEIAIEKLSNGIMNNQSDDETEVKHINVINMYDTDKIHPEKLTFSNYDEEAVKKCNVGFGDIFLTRSSLKPEGIAEANVLLDSGRFVYDDHLIRLKVNKEKYDPFFVKLNLSGNAFKRQFIVRAKTTAFTTIGQEDISECLGFFPKKEEQQQIGECFMTLDHLITLHHRKHFYLKIATKTLKITIQLTKGGRKNVRIGVNDREKTD